MFQYQGFDHTGEGADQWLERKMRERVAAIHNAAEHDALVRLAREAAGTPPLPSSQESARPLSAPG